MQVNAHEVDFYDIDLENMEVMVKTFVVIGKGEAFSLASYWKMETYQNVTLFHRQT